MTAKAYVALVLPIRGKQLAALRAVAGTPGGLRIAAYPTTMPLLAKMRFVEERPVPRGRHGEGRAWFLTMLGWEAIRA